MLNHLDNPMSVVKCIGNTAKNQRIEQRIVPMQVCGHPIFLLRNTSPLAALTRRATTPLSHDHLFHSVLDCVGIYSDAVERRLSLCTQGDFTEREGSFPEDNSGKNALSSCKTPQSATRATTAAIQMSTRATRQCVSRPFGPVVYGPPPGTPKWYSNRAYHIPTRRRMPPLEPNAF
jgi:hypothetical protein